MPGKATLLRISPLAPSRWPDLERLFGANGACGGCWCMFFHQSGPEYQAGKGEKNHRAFRRRVKAGATPGLLGYLGKEPVAWIALEPRENFERIARSKRFAGVAGERIWSTPCFFVKRGYRKRGLTRQMLEAAKRHARRRGGKILEGYPLELTGRTPAAFTYHGVASTFRAAGFEEVARPSKTRVIMRCQVA
jgi:GNAT superfamily N-acetyltransferase